jgi:hypothetical protein
MVLFLAFMCVILTGILWVAGSCALNVCGVSQIILHVPMVGKCGGRRAVSPPVEVIGELLAAMSILGVNHMR